jgi:DNA-binding MarR family transcriptional regulator
VTGRTPENMHDARKELYACSMQTSPFVLTEPIPAPETAEDALMSLMMALGRQMRHRQPGDVIDYSAFPILKLLTHQGPMRLSAVAQVLGLDASTVSRHARQLEDRGLLERTDDPDDRRASRVAVTEQGATCLAKGFETRRLLVADALGGWSDEERDTLRLLLHRLVQSLLTHPDPSDQTVATPTQETSA